MDAAFNYKNLWIRHKTTLLSLYQLQNELSYLVARAKIFDLDELFEKYQKTNIFLYKRTQKHSKISNRQESRLGITKQKPPPALESEPIVLARNCVNWTVKLSHHWVILDLNTVFFRKQPAAGNIFASQLKSPTKTVVLLLRKLPSLACFRSRTNTGAFLLIQPESKIGKSLIS